ncbi:BTAD domain-containing putative transcriptional regulator [Allokutzneria albata]|uniref:Predicted ATPase n=1 Tax=Allokutzneria albata TaxID=211114 RepID=A0A1G9SKZ0_ALLAB|nr:BTAD domain-containing putative transcriptional regulator [Allokutzneria albata]SDM36156.1 Predicted ATPase [Allokutzneria albata]
MRFGVLGPLAVWTDAGESVRVPGAKVRALLADLLVHAGEPVSADRLIEDLWGEQTPRDASGALHVKVSQLRRALASAEADARDLVVSQPAGYTLRVPEEAVDSGRFGALVRAARTASHPAEAAVLLSEALSLWRGEPLAEFAEEEFARAEAERLRELRLTAIEDHVEARLAVGEHASLIDELRVLVDRHPLRERLRAAQMRALYRAGRQTEALESYDRLRTELADELGIDPSPALVRLRQEILTQDPALDASPGAPRTTATNLPAPVSDLIGRASAVTEVRSALAAARLVTLVGPGGVGKTRLAVEAARGALDEAVDGVWLVELADVSRGAGVAEVIDKVAAAVGARDDTSADGLSRQERLAAALGGQRVLLVVDNCEHVVDSAAHVAESLLATAPELRVLATSREPLGIAGEQLVAVPPLELPDPEDDVDPGRAGRLGAVELFVRRAGAADPGFALRPDNVKVVAGICRALDGLPLAIELAASRVRALGVHDLAVRLDDRFRVLTTGPRTAPTRQRTLRSMIDWSWDLLSGSERAVLRRLAAHSVSLSLASAEVVCAGDPVAEHEVMDVLAQLVDRSLVTVVTDGDRTRYRLLDTIGAYARERLDEAGEVAATQLRHAEHFRDLVLSANSHLRGPEQREHLRLLDREAANTNAAVLTAVQLGETALGLDLVTGMAWYWYLRGTLQEGHRLLGAVLELTGPVASAGADALRARAWRLGFGFLLGCEPDPLGQGAEVLRRCAELDAPDVLARVRWWLAVAGRSRSPATARELFDEARVEFERLGDRWHLAAVLVFTAENALTSGDPETTAVDAARAASLFAELGDRWGQVQAAELLGAVADIAGDHGRAAGLYEGALGMAEELGLWPAVAQLLGRLTRVAVLRRDYPAAMEFGDRALRVATERSIAPQIGFASGGLALAARRMGLLDTAEAHLRATLEWERRIDYATGMAFILTQLGFVAEQRGDLDAAVAWHREGLAAARQTHDLRAVALSLEGFAGTRVLAGDPAGAARLLGVAEAAREAAGFPLPPAERDDVDRITEAGASALGAEAFAKELLRGKETPLDDVLSTLDWVSLPACPPQTSSSP